jgi:hypothetical protein
MSGLDCFDPKKQYLLTSSSYEELEIVELGEVAPGAVAWLLTLLTGSGTVRTGLEFRTLAFM